MTVQFDEISARWRVVNRDKVAKIASANEDAIPSVADIGSSGGKIEDANLDEITGTQIHEARTIRDAEQADPAIVLCSTTQGRASIAVRLLHQGLQTSLAKTPRLGRPRTSAPVINGNRHRSKLACEPSTTSRRFRVPHHKRAPRAATGAGRGGVREKSQGTFQMKKRITRRTRPAFLHIPSFENLGFLVKPRF